LGLRPPVPPDWDLNNRSRHYQYRALAKGYGG
jgi:hypothetical protein